MITPDATVTLDFALVRLAGLIEKLLIYPANMQKNQTLLKKDADVKKYLTDAEIEQQFDLGYHFEHVDTIFGRVFGEN